MPTVIRENLLRPSELAEGMSDVLAAAGISEEANACQRLLGMSDHALAISRALERIGIASTQTAIEPKTTAIQL